MKRGVGSLLWSYSVAISVASIVQLSSLAVAMSPLLIPGGVVDPNVRTGFVVGESGNVEALDLTTGRSFWSLDLKAGNDARIRPLIAWQNRLAILIDGRRAQAGVQVVLVDSGANGRVIARSGDLPNVPRGMVKAGVLPPLGVAATLDNEQRWLELTLTQSEHVEYGVDPLALPSATGPRTNSNHVRIDVNTGRVETEKSTRPSSARATLPKQLVGALSQPYWKAGHLRSEPLVADDQLFVLDQDADPSAIQLKAWDFHGREIRSTKLPKPKSTAPIVTMDGKHLLVEDNSPSASPRFIVVSLMDDRRSTIALGQKIQEAAIFDNLALVAILASAGKKSPQALLLVGYSLKDSKRLWEYPIRAAPISSEPKARRP